MATRLLHFLAMIAVLATCLVGGERAVFCVTDEGSWKVHVVLRHAGEPSEACVPAPADSDCEQACGNGGCTDTEVQTVIKQPSPPRVDAKILALPVMPGLLQLAILPPSSAVAATTSRAWSALHAPPAPSVTETLGIRQI